MKFGEKIFPWCPLGHRHNNRYNSATLWPCSFSHPRTTDIEEWKCDELKMIMKMKPRKLQSLFLVGDNKIFIMSCYCHMPQNLCFKIHDHEPPLSYRATIPFFPWIPLLEDVESLLPLRSLFQEPKMNVSFPPPAPSSGWNRRQNRWQSFYIWLLYLEHWDNHSLFDLSRTFCQIIQYIFGHWGIPYTASNHTYTVIHLESRFHLW